MFSPASVWFCCQPATTQAAVGIVAGLFGAALNQPIPADAFDTAWGLTDFYAASDRSAALWLFGLEDTVIVIPDELPIPAVGIVNVLLWLDIEGFLLTGGGACGDGCDAPSFLVS